jgi:hypothetical protein
MNDEIIINLRGLTQRQRNTILEVLKQALIDIDDETNEEALQLIIDFEED